MRYPVFMTDTNSTIASAGDSNQAQCASTTSRFLARVVLDKVQRAALGAALTKPEIAESGLQATGCLVALILWASTMAKEGASTLWMPEADALAALSRRGVAFGDDARMLRSLELAGAIVRADGLISIPSLDAALAREGQKQVNRKKGWEKRNGGSGSDMGIGSPAREGKPQPARAAEQKPAQTQHGSIPESAGPVGKPSAEAKPCAAPVQTSLMPETDVLTPPVAASKARKSADDVLRGPKEVEPTPVAVEVPLSGDKVGAVSMGYVAYLQETFAGVDALAQVKLAAAWSQAQPARRKTRAGLARFLNSWLMSAQREALMRKSISRAASARNGFGQGGDSLIAVDHTAARAPAEDDFSDLQAEPAALHSQAGAQQEEVVEAPSTLATKSNGLAADAGLASPRPWRSRFNRAFATAPGVAA